MPETMTNSTNPNHYHYPDGSVDTNKVSNLTGTFTADLVQSVWEYSGYSENAINNLFEKLERLNEDGREAEFMGLLKTVCGKVSFAFSDEIETATQDPQVRTAFILSLLSDFDDAMLDL